MSRLDSFISRMSAQRDILNHIRSEPAMLPYGVILEVGLGNGRTFDHLREIFPERRIIAFDRAVGAHLSSVPDPENMVVGEIRETGKAFAGANAALLHADIGTGYPEKDAITLTWLPEIASAALAPGGLAVSGLPLEHPSLEEIPAPASVEKGRYFLYRKRG